MSITTSFARGARRSNSHRSSVAPGADAANPTVAIVDAFSRAGGGRSTLVSLTAGSFLSSSVLSLRGISGYRDSLDRESARAVTWIHHDDRPRRPPSRAAARRVRVDAKPGRGRGRALRGRRYPPVHRPLPQGEDRGPHRGPAQADQRPA